MAAGMCLFQHDIWVLDELFHVCFMQKHILSVALYMALCTVRTKTNSFTRILIAGFPECKRVTCNPKPAVLEFLSFTKFQMLSEWSNLYYNHNKCTSICSRRSKYTLYSVCCEVVPKLNKVTLNTMTTTVQKIK